MRRKLREGERQNSQINFTIDLSRNADCIVRIDQDEFHCHLLVLQSYSAFFDEKNCKEIDLTGVSYWRHEDVIYTVSIYLNGRFSKTILPSYNYRDFCKATVRNLSTPLISDSNFPKL